MDPFHFTLDTGLELTLTEEDLREEARSSIEYAIEKEYRLEELTPDFIAEEITGIGGHGMPKEGLDIIQQEITQFIQFLKKGHDEDEITIHCYSDNLISHREGEYETVLDRFSDAWFTVPTEWAAWKAKRIGYKNLEEFLGDYTYDTVDRLIDVAIEDGVLLGCGAGKMEQGRSIRTRRGEITMTPTSDTEYPGMYIGVNGEDLVLVEYDSLNDAHTVRVWNENDPDNDPEYVQRLKNDNI